jgi:hypothetical protein
MGRDSNGGSFLDGLRSKFLRRKPVDAPAPVNPVLGMLDRLHAGEQPDYCLYLRPAAGAAVKKDSPLAVDVEELLVKAFDPLPVLTLDESNQSASDAGLPDESFLTLANRARVLCLVPTADGQFIKRLRVLKTIGPVRRCIFVMPQQGTLGSADWPAIWPAACEAARALGIELSGYTAGGWLFRLDAEGKSCTFRPIVNPNPEKVARALEAICAEMG